MRTGLLRLIGLLVASGAMACSSQAVTPVKGPCPEKRIDCAVVVIAEGGAPVYSEPALSSSTLAGESAVIRPLEYITVDPDAGVTNADGRWLPWVIETEGDAFAGPYRPWRSPRVKGWIRAESVVMVRDFVAVKSCWPFLSFKDDRTDMLTKFQFDDAGRFGEQGILLVHGEYFFASPQQGKNLDAYGDLVGRFAFKDGRWRVWLTSFDPAEDESPFHEVDEFRVHVREGMPARCANGPLT